MGSFEQIITTVTAVSYNMAFQFLFRIGTFIMNAVLLRYITKEMLGIVNVRLSLLYYTIIFISREAFRKACLSRNKEHVSQEKRKKMVNLIWVCVIVGIISSIILCLLWILYLEQPSYELVYSYKVCTVMFAMSAIIEMLAEQLWIFGQCYSFVRLKAIIDGIYVMTRCIVSVTMVICFPDLGILSFGIAFITSSLVYTLLYYIYFLSYISNLQEGDPFPFRNLKDLFPDFNMAKMFDPYYTNLVTSFYKQSLIKQFLTEGEKYIMTLFSILSFGEQGIYDIVNNLGSLAARIIFMPIEESYYIFYSLLLVRGKTGKEHPPDDLQTAAKSLSLVLKFVTMIGFIVLVFGYSYSYLLLQLYGGSILTENEGPALLKTYCLYVLVMAVNGITECFMFAAMHQTEVDKYNYKMLVFSVVFLTASLAFTKYFGAVGFILANCVNMLLRISHSVQFIHKFFKGTEYNPLYSVIPSPVVMVTLAASAFVTCMSEKNYCCGYGYPSILIHITVGAVCLGFVLLATLFTEDELSSFIKNFIGRKRGVAMEKQKAE